MKFIFRKLLKWRRGRCIARQRVFLKDFLANCKRQNKSKFTIKNYACDLEKFLNWFSLCKRMRFEKIRSHDLAQYFEFLSQGGLVRDGDRIMDQSPLSPNSVRRHISCLNNFFEYLKQTYEEQGRFKINPIKKHLHFIKIKEIDVEHTKYLKDQDWEKLQEVIRRTRDRLMVKLLYFGGLRLQELQRLKRNNFNESLGIINIERKGGKRHKLLLQNWDSIKKDYDYYLTLFPKKSEDYLFTSKKGLPLSTKSIYNTIIKLLRSAGCTPGLVPHSFRKACATNLYLRTKDLLFVRDYLNHKDAKVTQTYIDYEAAYRARTERLVGHHKDQASI
jgi:site-specific recombinase XerD